MKFIKIALQSIALMFFVACSSDEPTPETVLPDTVETGVVGTMIKVQGGTFTMGCDTSAVDEAPAHQVTLSTYYIGEFEVTQGEWKSIMAQANPSYNPTNDSLPVEQVSWTQVQTFITALNTATGKTFRLPTEAEWEFAARGGVKSLGYKYSGSNKIDSVGWYLGNNESENTQKVGRKLPNELGLYDMSGNVAEWCEDRYGVYTSTAQTNPTGATSGSTKVFRGGRCDFDADDALITSRRSDGVSKKYYNLGFRLVMQP